MRKSVVAVCEINKRKTTLASTCNNFTISLLNCMQIAEVNVYLFPVLYR